MTTLILTWNPQHWDWPQGERTAAIVSTSKGDPVVGRWSCGSRRYGVTPGADRPYLLRQGETSRGIVASGRVIYEPYEEEHWDPARAAAGDTAWYVDVLWHHVVTDEDRLPIEVLLEAVPQMHWQRIQGSGQSLPSPGAEDLERLWSRHLVDLLGHRPKPPTEPSVGGDSDENDDDETEDGVGHEPDPARRTAIEQHAQRLLENHYLAKGWDVTDDHIGNPYDALAIKGDQVRYLVL